MPSTSFFIVDQLLKWYDIHHRHLPWRITPQEQKNGKTSDPYTVWLSEIMLQQTTVEAVKPYYQKFLNKWPNIYALAKASQEEILQNWAGLGYYSRARNLKHCAEEVVKKHQGRLPDNYSALKELKGIGDYTASAISAIAFNKNIAVVDSNIERIICRIFAIKTILPKAKNEIKAKMQGVMPKERPGDFAQAMMDLGALICKAKHPLCSLCPLKNFCFAFQNEQTHLFPIKPQKQLRAQKYGKAFVAVSKNNKIYLEKRQDKGLLAQMTQVPNYFSDTPQQDFKPIFEGDWIYCGQVKHIFTHFSLSLDVYRAEALEEESSEDPQQEPLSWWCAKDKLQEQALPTLMKKVLKSAFNDTGKRPQ